MSNRLQRFEKTNEMLINCNALSNIHLQKATKEFKKHIQVLHEIKKDLDYIFKKIRLMKLKAASQFPDQFNGKFLFK